MYECFCRLRPGVPLLALYGKQKQMKRMGIYNDFRKKQHAYLFATDIAARGLDFPAVNWVIQLDCPEDASTYIHRAGRTARYEKDGQALLMLLPSEREGMLKVRGVRVCACRNFSSFRLLLSVSLYVMYTVLRFDVEGLVSTGSCLLSHQCGTLCLAMLSAPTISY